MDACLESSGIVPLMVMPSYWAVYSSNATLSSVQVLAVHIGQNSGWQCLDYLIGFEDNASIGFHCLLCID